MKRRMKECKDDSIEMVPLCWLGAGGH
jgi:hypothetical protein